MASHAVADEFVIYIPPKSAGFGHAARRRDPVRAWAEIQHFLATHTNARLERPLRLNVWGPSEWTPQAVSEQAIAEVIREFGMQPKRSGIHNLWDLSPDHLPQALQLAFAHRQRPKQQLGSLDLNVRFDVEWRELRAPSLTSVFPSSVPPSSLGVSIGLHRTVFIQPIFSFLRPYGAPDFRFFLDRLELDLPFVWRDDWFRRVVPRKNGERIVKLKKGWRSTGAAM